MTIPEGRVTVQGAGNKLGLYAVMRHAESTRNAKLCALHPDYETACAEAIRLMTGRLAEDSVRQHTFFVLEVAAQFSAGPLGMSSRERGLPK